MHEFKDVDVVFHLAAHPSVQESINNPLETSGINLFGTINVLEACRSNKVKKVIFSSSCAIYGDADVNEGISEETVANPLSPYALQKYLSEESSITS